MQVSRDMRDVGGRGSPLVWGVLHVRPALGTHSWGQVLVLAPWSAGRGRGHSGSARDREGSGPWRPGGGLGGSLLSLRPLGRPVRVAQPFGPALAWALTSICDRQGGQPPLPPRETGAQGGTPGLITQLVSDGAGLRAWDLRPLHLFLPPISQRQPGDSGSADHISVP